MLYYSSVYSLSHWDITKLGFNIGFKLLALISWFNIKPNIINPNYKSYILNSIINHNIKTNLKSLNIINPNIMSIGAYGEP